MNQEFLELCKKKKVDKALEVLHGLIYQKEPIQRILITSNGVEND